jgi:hypothetical protein
MILYKYLTVQKATEWLIEENSILLTPPIYLNDLTEFHIRREPPDLEERRALFEMCQRESPSKLTFAEYDLAITRKEFVDSEAGSMREGLSKIFGVVSLSSEPADQLMWAHYGMNSGVAVGYRSSNAVVQDGMRGRSLPLGLALEVNYTDAAVPITKDFQNAASVLTSKRTCWAYEKEWRIVDQLSKAKAITRDDKTFYALPAHREEIATVVFGANASQEFIGRVSDWLRGTGATRQILRLDPLSNNLVLTEADQIS